MKAFSGVAAQILSTATNALLVLTISLQSSAADFGVFAICYSVIGFLVGLARNALFDHLLIRSGRNEITASTLILSVQLTLCYSLTISVAAFIYFIFVQNQYAEYLLIFGIGAAVLLVNDMGRFVAIAKDDAKSAIVSDFIWFVVALLLLVVSVDTQYLIMLWILGSLFGMISNKHARNSLRDTFKQSELKKYKDILDFSYVYDFGLLYSRGLVLVLAFSISYGSEAAAIIAISQFVFTPLNAFVVGLRFTYLRIISSKHLSTVVVPWSWYMVLMIAGLLWSLLLGVIPLDFATRIFGESFAVMRPFLVFVCVFEIYRLLEYPMIDWFKARGDSQFVLFLRACSFLLLIVLSTSVYFESISSIDSALFYRMLVGVCLVMIYSMFSYYSRGKYFVKDGDL